MIPKLLVSVRDANEALLVSQYGIGIIDAKEPRAGSLGKVPDVELREVLKVVPPGQNLSLALGELDASNAFDWDHQLLAQFDYAKIGLSRAADRRDWEADLFNLMSRLPANVSRVAVAYVDYERCRAPRIAQVISAGIGCGCTSVLLDTYGKSAGDLFAYLDLPQLRQIVREIKAHEMQVVVAGSISNRTLPAVLDCEPDFVGVRGAVCQGGRESRIDETELSRFVNLFLKLRETKFSHPNALRDDLD